MISQGRHLKDSRYYYLRNSTVKFPLTDSFLFSRIAAASLENRFTLQKYEEQLARCEALQAEGEKAKEKLRELESKALSTSIELRTAKREVESLNEQLVAARNSADERVERQTQRLSEEKSSTRKLFRLAKQNEMVGSLEALSLKLSSQGPRPSRDKIHPREGATRSGGEAS